MGYIEKFDNHSKIIGKSGSRFLVTNNQTATLYDSLESAAVLDETGKYLIESLPIDYFTRNVDYNWEILNAKYGDYIKRKESDMCLDGLIGLAVGDALGVPVEFLSRDEIRQINIKDMVGMEDNLPFKSRWGSIIPSGAWSDDTSMTIAAMDTIVKDNGDINYDHIMNSFISWWYYGEYTSLDFSFGLGGVISRALHNYQSGIPALECGGSDYGDNGNGSLMRILPFSIYAVKTDMTEEETVDFINKASSLTHAHDISKMGCFIYTEFLKYLDITKNPELAYQRLLSISYSKYYSREAIEAYGADLINMKEDDLPEKNGYVATTLKSAIYSLLHTSNYEDAVLQAINLGYDTDTIGAVTGSLAGILYGYDNIPDRWKKKLRKLDMLENISNSFTVTIHGLK